MKKIRIQELILENFKCHSRLRLAFSGDDARVYGDNGVGKTSIYDGITWLLFGRDSLGTGEKSLSLKPLDADGNVKDREAVTAVEAVLTVDGVPVRLRRTLRELWASRRGQRQRVYEGNISEYYVDGVACKKAAFQEKIGQIVSEEHFRMLTGVRYFAQELPWQRRREILFDISGGMTDQQILLRDVRFLPLAEAMGEQSPDGLRAKLCAEKRGLVGARSEIPARLSECRKALEELGAVDTAGEEAVLQELNARKDVLSAQLLGLSRSTALQEKRMKLQQAQLELRQLEKAGVQAPGEKLCREEARKQRLVQRKKELEEKLEQLEVQLQECRGAWAMAETRQVTVEQHCPVCGQPLPPEQVEKAKAAALREKARQVLTLREAVDAKQQALEEARAALKDNGQTLEETEERLCQLQMARSQSPDRRQMLRETVQRLQQEVLDMSRSTSQESDALRQQLRELNGRIREQMELCGKKSALEFTRQRMEALRRDGERADRELERVDEMLQLLEEFSHFKAGFLEEQANSLFRIARFRLFREQANGGIEERCDVVYDGVPYLGLNNGMRINVGIDIINTLSRAFGVQVPLFVDNAEGVTQLEAADTQVIRLIVSPGDQVLRVEK